MLRITVLGIVVALGSACASSTPGETESDGGLVQAPDASPMSDARAVEPTARGSFCGAGGRSQSGDTRVTLCAGPVDLVTEQRKQGDITWRPGPIYVIEPSGGN